MTRKTKAFSIVLMVMLAGCSADFMANPAGDTDGDTTLDGSDIPVNGPQYPCSGVNDPGPLPGADFLCLQPVEDQDGGENPIATVEWASARWQGIDAIHIRLTFDPEFVDNSYGENARGWTGKKGHKFKDLVGSDHAQLLVVDAAKVGDDDGYRKSNHQHTAQ